MSDVKKLLRTLQHMMPPASVVIANEQSWFSRTFSGLQLRIKARMCVANRRALADAVTQRLADLEFDLSAHFVADIAVAERIDNGVETILLIDVLLLEA